MDYKDKITEMMIINGVKSDKNTPKQIKPTNKEGSNWSWIILVFIFIVVYVILSIK